MEIYTIVYMSNISLLVTRPNHDLATNGLYYWAGLIIKKAKDKNIIVYDLEKEKANRKMFISYIKKRSPNIIFFNGHGNTNKITGFNNETLVDIQDKENFLRNTVVYARSCSSAVSFGVESVKRGTKAFIGYKDKFIVIFSNITIPLKDKIATFFLEPSNLVVETLLKNNNPQEAYLRSQNNSLKKIKFLLSEKSTKGEKTLIPFLWSNMKAQVIID